MFHRYAIIALAVSSVLAGCSSIETRKQATGGFDYLNAKQIDRLNLPDGFQSPQYENDYQIPELKSDQPLVVGTQLDIRSPTLVLATPAGTRIDPNMALAQVWVDKVYEGESLDVLLWNSVDRFLSSTQVAVKSRNDKVVESNWISAQDNPTIINWAEVGSNRSFRFEYDWDMKSHGRSGLLTVKLVEFVEDRNGELVDLMSTIDRERIETEILNVTLLNYNRELVALNSQDGASRLSLVVEMGFDEAGNPAILVGADKIKVWTDLPMVFEYFRIETESQDRSKLSYQVNYEGADPSVWEKIWGDEVPAVPIPVDSYRFQVGEIENMASITIFSSNGEPISPQLVDRIFVPMSQAIDLIGRQ